MENYSNPQWPVIVVRKPSAFVFGVLTMTVANLCMYWEGDMTSIWVFWPMYLFVIVCVWYFVVSFTTYAGESQSDEYDGNGMDDEERQMEKAKVSINLMLVSQAGMYVMFQCFFLVGCMPRQLGPPVIHELCDGYDGDVGNATNTGSTNYSAFENCGAGWAMLPSLVLFGGYTVAGLISGNLIFGDERMEADSREALYQVRLYIVASGRHICPERRPSANTSRDPDAGGIVCGKCGTGGLGPQSKVWLCEDCNAILRLTPMPSRAPASAPTRDIHITIPGRSKTPPPPPAGAAIVTPCIISDDDDDEGFE